MWGRKPPPAPPPASSWEPSAGNLLCGGLVLLLTWYSVALLRVMSSKGADRVNFTRRSAYYCLPCYPALLLVFHAALVLAGCPRTSPIPPRLVETDMTLTVFLISPIAGFGLLLLSELLSWIFVSVLGPAKRYAHFRQPIMGVHATTLLFYLLAYTTDGTVTLEDRFGRPLYPERYLMWFVSVSSLGQSVFMLLDAMSGPSPNGAHDILVRYLFAVPVC